MDLLCWKVVCVYITVFVVVFCGELLYRVEGQIINIFNYGDDITISCYPPNSKYDNYAWFKRDVGSPVASITGDRFYQSQGRISQSLVLDYSGSNSQYNLFIHNVNYRDSGTYQCHYAYSGYAWSKGPQYHLLVIGCSCNLVDREEDNEDMTKEKVVCNLLNDAVSLDLPSYIRNIYVTTNKGRQLPVSIQGNAFSFLINISKLKNDFHVEIHPYDNAIGNVTCIVPALVTSPQPSTNNDHRTSPTPTTTNRRPTSSTPTPKYLEDSTSGETTKYLTPSNEILSLDNNDTRNGNITLIIAIVGSVCILILIVIIFFLCRKSRPKAKHNGNVTPNKDEHSPEACYESVEDGLQKGPKLAASIEPVGKTVKENVDGLHNGEMVENILYDSSDRIADNSISRTEGPLDNALYAMPDKRATINRESKAKTVDASCDLDALYGNNDIVSQHGMSKDTRQRADQYENIEMPGSVTDAEEIQLYAMPDKASKRNTLKTAPKPDKTTTLSKDDVVDADALYAEVDKPKK